MMVSMMTAGAHVVMLGLCLARLRHGEHASRRQSKDAKRLWMIEEGGFHGD
jgi:hypothetical protein